MRPMGPCKDCQERTITCHGFCQRYQEFKRQNEEYVRLRDVERQKHYTNQSAQKAFWKKLKRPAWTRKEFRD